MQSGGRASSSARCATTLARQPNPKSINGLLRAHNDERLFVPPLHWTLRHLQLLGCCFALREPPPDVDEANIDSIRTLVKNLHYRSEVEFETSTVSRFLERHGLDRNPDLHLQLYFGQHAVASVQTGAVFSAGRSGPVLAYLDFGIVRNRRRESIKSSMNIKIRILRRLEPANEVEDPYIAAVLIAVAQQRRRHLDDIGNAAPAERPLGHVSPESGTKEAQGTASDIEVYTIARPTNKSGLIFYKAVFPAAFLKRLDSPSEDIQCGRMEISYYRIPIYPKAEALVAVNWLIKTLVGACSKRPDENDKPVH